MNKEPTKQALLCVLPQPMTSYVTNEDYDHEDGIRIFLFFSSWRVQIWGVFIFRKWDPMG